LGQSELCIQNHPLRSNLLTMIGAIDQ